MKKEEVINLVLRDMVLAGFVIDDKREHVKFHLDLVWTAGYEYRSREFLAHNKKAVVQYNRMGKKIASYESILEAAAANKLSRDVIDSSISGRTKYTRKQGYYFRYAENGTPENDS